MIRQWLITKLDTLVTRLDAIADQHAPDDVRAKARHEALMTVKVIRANGEVEDKGIISRTSITDRAAKRLLKDIQS
jgi:hypothetical protein